MDGTVTVSAEHAGPSSTGDLISSSSGRHDNLFPLDFNLDSVQLSLVSRESWGSIEKKAYDEAVEQLEGQLKGKDLEWLKSITQPGKDPSSILGDLLAEAQKQESKYSLVAVSGKPVIRGIRRLSQSIMHYGKVLDTLSNHHPEYVSLVWGLIKFVLMGVLNHEKLVQQFSDQLAHIADALPLTKIDVELYQTEGMRRELAGIYQHILLFLRQATKWYGASSAQRALTALSVNSEKKFHETLENIEKCATNITNIAAVGNRADVRRVGTILESGLGDIGTWQRQHEETLQGTNAQLTQLMLRVANIGASVESLRYAFASGGETLHAQRLLLNTHNGIGRASWTEVNLRQILPTLELAGNPEDALARHQSLARQASPWRRPHRDDNDLYRDLRAWVKGDTTSTLVLQARPLAQKRIRQIITTALAALQHQGQAAIWRLSDAGAEQDGCSAVEGVRVVLQTLIAQAIRLSPETLRVSHTDSNSLRPSGHHSEEELLTLLVLILRRIGTCFVVIEAEDVRRPRDAIALVRVAVVSAHRLSGARQAAFRQLPAVPGRLDASNAHEKYRARCTGTSQVAQAGRHGGLLGESSKGCTAMNTGIGSM